MNIEKLMKSFEAFINHDTDTATKLYREYFIESAQAINSEMEDQLDEEFGGDMEGDLYDEVVAEAEGDEEENPFGGDDAAEEEPAEESPFGGDDMGGEAEGEDVVVPADEWQEIQDQFDELEAMFAEMSDGSFEGEDDDLNFDDEGGEDEISFGDDEDELQEGYQMRSVKDPGMKSETEADNVKPVLASQKPSPVGVSATAGYAGDGKVKGSNTKRDTPDAETPKVEDHNNVMANGKKAYQKSSQAGASKKEKDVDGSAKQSLIKDIR